VHQETHVLGRLPKDDNTRKKKTSLTASYFWNDDLQVNDDDISGEVDICLQLLYDPDLDRLLWRPTFVLEQEQNNTTSQKNCLMIGLFGARISNCPQAIDSRISFSVKAEDATTREDDDKRYRKRSSIRRLRKVLEERTAVQYPVFKEEYAIVLPASKEGIYELTIESIDFNYITRHADLGKRTLTFDGRGNILFKTGSDEQASEPLQYEDEKGRLAARPLQLETEFTSTNALDERVEPNTQVYVWLGLAKVEEKLAEEKVGCLPLSFFPSKANGGGPSAAETDEVEFANFAQKELLAARQRLRPPRFLGGRTMPSSSVGTNDILFAADFSTVLPARRCPWLEDRRGTRTSGGGGAPSAADGDEQPIKRAKPSISKVEDDAESEAATVMNKVDTAVVAGLGTLAVLATILTLRKSLKVLRAKWNEAIKALAFVENAIPKIVSSIETIETIVQILLKSLQSVAFPPSPLALVGLLHDFKKIFKQAQAIYETFTMKKALADATNLLVDYAKELAQLITVVAYLKNNCCGTCF